MDFELDVLMPARNTRAWTKWRAWRAQSLRARLVKRLEEATNNDEETLRILADELGAGEIQDLFNIKPRAFMTCNWCFHLCGSLTGAPGTVGNMVYVCDACLADV